MRTSLASKKTLPVSGSSIVVCAVSSLPGVTLGAVNFQSYVCFMLMNGDTWKSFSNLKDVIVFTGGGRGVTSGVVNSHSHVDVYI